MQSRQEQQLAREALFTQLYTEVFPTVAGYIAKKGGNLEQAKDLFQEALVIYYEQVELRSKSLEKNAKAYLIGVSRNLWHQQATHGLNHESIDNLNNEPDVQISPMVSTKKLLKTLATTGRKCMDMLRAFYYEQIPLDQIAHQFGFGSVRSATVQKYKCLEKVRDEVKEKSLTYADFTD